MEEETYNTEGPECPECGTVFTAYGPEYYDEAEGLEIECNCGLKLHAQPYIRTSWTTWVKS